MPAYFEITFQTKFEQLNDTVVYTVNHCIIENGFSFKSGCWHHEQNSILEIEKYNQELLNKKFILGKKQKFSEGLRQIEFNTNLFSELRCFWHTAEDEVSFNLIIPEEDILSKNIRGKFVKSKILPVIDLSKEIWNLNIFECIQASSESYNGRRNVSQVINSKDITIFPFGIVKKSVYEKFNINKFDQMSVTTIGNDSVIIEDNVLISIE